MRRQGFIFIAIVTLFMLSGCSSYFKRKSCEKINWHEHGYKVAMRGERLTGDETYNSCVKVEAEMSHSEADTGFKAGMKKYCTPEHSLSNGKKGVLQNFEFCGVSQSSKMARAHKKGVIHFCRKSNGYKFGAKGGVYNNICPKKMESAWLPEYHRGRRIYLKDQISAKEQSISHIEDEISDFEKERRNLNNQIILLPRGKKMTSERQYNPDTNTYKEETLVTEDDETRRKREDLEYRLRGVTRKINKARDRQKNIRGEIRSMKTEIRSLTR